MLPTAYATICRKSLPTAQTLKALAACLFGVVCLLARMLPASGQRRYAAISQNDYPGGIGLYSFFGDKYVTELYGTEDFVYTVQGKNQYGSTADYVEEMHVRIYGNKYTIDTSIHGSYSVTSEDVNTNDRGTITIINLSGENHIDKPIMLEYDKYDFNLTHIKTYYGSSAPEFRMWINTKLKSARFVLERFAIVKYHADYADNKGKSSSANVDDSGDAAGLGYSEFHTIIQVPDHIEGTTPSSVLLRKTDKIHRPRTFPAVVEGHFDGTSITGNLSARMLSAAPKEYFSQDQLSRSDHAIPGKLQVSWNLSIKPVKTDSTAPVKSPQANPAGTPNDPAKPEPSKCPDLSATYDLAHYIDTHSGELPCCLRDEIAQKYKKYATSSGLWFSEETNGAHNYIAINSLGKYDKKPDAVVDILDKNIGTIFPGGAVEEDSKSTTIEAHHKYMLSPPIIPNFVWTAEVECTEASSYHFTFSASTIPGKHVLQGTAIHGVFKDKCGELWMFQQGKGVPGENIFSEKAAPFAAMWLGMWRIMAVNLKDKIGN